MKKEEMAKKMLRKPNKPAKKPRSLKKDTWDAGDADRDYKDESINDLKSNW